MPLATELAEVVVGKAVLEAKIAAYVSRLAVQEAKIETLNQMLVEERRRGGRLQEDLDALRARDAGRARGTTPPEGAVWARAEQAVVDLGIDRQRDHLRAAIAVLVALPGRLDMVMGTDAHEDRKLDEMSEEISKFVKALLEPEGAPT